MTTETSWYLLRPSDGRLVAIRTTPFVAAFELSHGGRVILADRSALAAYAEDLRLPLETSGRFHTRVPTGVAGEESMAATSAAECN